jgi:Ca-activated chloride channel family protein
MFRDNAVRVLHPEQAVWLLIVPAIWSVWFLHASYRERARRRADIRGVLRRLSRATGWGRELMVVTLTSVAAAALVAAIVRPQIFQERRLPEYERQDLVLLLDRSVSMRAEDVRPSRFSRAIEEIQNFLQHKPDTIERVGLVGFAGSSVILSYLTPDVESLLFYLEWIEEQPEPLYGTDIGAALNSGLELVKKAGGRNKKLFLMVSDGEDTGGQLAPALALTQRADIRVYSIGIGGDRDATIPVLDENGRRTFLRDEDGRIVRTRFSEVTLTNIAQVTGARYFRSKTGRELAAAIDEIVRQERKVVGWTQTAAFFDLYPYALLTAAIAFAGLLLII